MIQGRSRSMGYFLPLFLLSQTIKIQVGAQEFKNTVPSINIQLTDSVTIFNTRKIAYDKNIVVLLFNSNCDHCQQLARDIVRRKKELEKNLFVMISTEYLHAIRAFYSKFGLVQMKNLIIGRDYMLATPKIFSFESFPFCIIYSKKHRYLAYYERNFSVDTILKKLKN